ncbi:hypothetical protein CAEBREN_07316 [Caenorhabditis brenneri]|uniref:Uncharacterized protein n=1 Tax=Caenorhabditis brenneri TaxID=135651 RepID=G0MXW4_CAEBE|nr:hypothetical protein CAEBREN_07316 [Caenorhabditis brenneri]
MNFLLTKRRLRPSLSTLPC